jgi:hypothetical protein
MPKVRILNCAQQFTSSKKIEPANLLLYLFYTVYSFLIFRMNEILFQAVS